MAMWYMLGNEEEVASWLLWERKSMMELGKKVEVGEASYKQLEKKEEKAKSDIKEFREKNGEVRKQIYNAQQISC